MASRDAPPPGALREATLAGLVDAPEEEEEKVMAEQVRAVISPERSIGEQVRPVICTGIGGGEGHGRASKCHDIAGA